jgi:hypothetical protein
MAYWPPRRRRRRNDFHDPQQSRKVLSSMAENDRSTRNATLTRDRFAGAGTASHRAWRKPTADNLPGFDPNKCNKRTPKL